MRRVRTERRFFGAASSSPRGCITSLTLCNAPWSRPATGGRNTGNGRLMKSATDFYSRWVEPARLLYMRVCELKRWLVHLAQMHGAHWQPAASWRRILREPSCRLCGSIKTQLLSDCRRHSRMYFRGNGISSSHPRAYLRIKGPVNHITGMPSGGLGPLSAPSPVHLPTRAVKAQVARMGSRSQKSRYTPR